MEKTIFNTSGYEQAIKTLLMGVAGDSAKVQMVGSAGGHIWSSKCVEVENKYGRFNETTIKKNGKVVGKFIYNYDTEKETEHVFDSITKTFNKVEEKEVA